MNIFIRAGHTYSLEINFLPMTLGCHECSIVLCDPDIGEMEYIIEGKAQNPPPFKIPVVSMKFEK